eukprot:TRINITY_DN14863_c0_g1_i1.p1 TRINITY_DN14863_c0_g1~~TRINITY_DN14863_c0_g1_i1.p1  ORF type:complete len:248 (+),score=85.85 TRINITY_DN14863_c0_g1_i1:421-1164(+)
MSGESIYDLIPPPPRRVHKDPLHKSKFKGQDTLNQTISTMPKVKKQMGTMGPPKVPVKNTKNFLKKHEKDMVLPDPEPFVRKGVVARKPAVPKRSERPLMGVKTEKNFVTANAVDAILSVPSKRPQEEFNFTKKKDFGKKPAYLDKVKNEVEAERQYIEEWERMQQEQDYQEMTPGGQVAMLSEEERQELLAGMKANWQKINLAYQTLSFSLDTPAKRIKKERYEAEMAQLEQDIARLSKQYVFVQQ